jgi:transposase-like protein
VSKSTASRICRELRARYKAFCARGLADVELLALFLDAIYLPTRPSGEKKGVLLAWGYTTQGKRGLIAVRLGQRERDEDWLELGRDLTRRALRAPWLVVSDGAPGLVKAINERWHEADRQRCTVHRLRNILAKLPKRPELREQVNGAYSAALDEALDPKDAERRLRELVSTLEREYPSAAACLAEDLPALCVHLKYLPRQRRRFGSSNLLERSLEEVRRRTEVIGRFPVRRVASACAGLCLTSSSPAHVVQLPTVRIQLVQSVLGQHRLTEHRGAGPPG